MKPIQTNYSFPASLGNIEDLNSSFAVGTLRVAYAGQNRNGTNITKEAFEQSVPSMYNCPIVANYDTTDESIGGHDADCVETADGELKYINLTEPVGVVPESATWHWEQIDDGGVTHDYFCIDKVILWKRQPCYERLAKNQITYQSMEINIVNATLDSGDFIINDFEYEAFCLLERDEPCFEQASLSLFNKTDFKQQFADMLKEYSMICNEQEEKEEGGGEMPQEVQELNDVADGNVEITAAANPAVVEDEPAVDFALLVSQKRDALSKVFSDYYRDTNVDYWVEDFTEDEVFVYSYTDGKIYGFTYQTTETSVLVDFDSKKEKMLQYVDVTEDAVSNASLADVIQAIVDNSQAEMSAAHATEVDGLNAQIETLQTSLNELEGFKATALANERHAQESELFSRFDTQLKNVNEYQQLKEQAADFSISELETQCYVLIGKQSFSSKKDHIATAQRIPVDHSTDSTNAPYGGLLEKFNQKYGGNK